jgi:hypothetical protein
MYLTHLEPEHQISARAPLDTSIAQTLQTQHVALVHSRRHLDGHALAHAHAAFPLAAAVLSKGSYE